MRSPDQPDHTQTSEQPQRILERDRLACRAGVVQHHPVLEVPPVKPGSDRRSGWLSTHPSLQARIARLQTLQGLSPADIEITGIPVEET